MFYVDVERDMIIKDANHVCVFFLLFFLEGWGVWFGFNSFIMR
jgi:hypothetical protein